MSAPHRNASVQIESLHADLDSRMVELASIAERRIDLLLVGHNGLPELLMEDTGLIRAT